MNLLHPAKLIYWGPTRTGSRYVFRLLKETYDAGDPEFHCSHTHNIRWDPEFADYKVVCTVRNPYHRVLSAWKWLNEVGRGGESFYADSFADFVRRIMPHGILPITSELGRLVEKVDYVIHLESCERDLKKIPYFPANLEFPDNTYRSEYRLTPGEYYADPCLVDAVWKTYREDFETFGYARGCYVEDMGGR